LILQIEKFENCKVVLEAAKGEQIRDLLTKGNVPDVLILDLEVPVKNSLLTLDWLQQNHPSLPVIVLSSIEPELLLIDILNKGIRCFMKKRNFTGRT